MVEIGLLAVGLFGLWLGTELTISGAVRISQQFGLSQLFIGLTVLAFGTDLPELVVSINGAIRNLRGIESSGVVVGNAIGSSVCQISIVLGTAAICQRLMADRRHIAGMSIGLMGSVLLLLLIGLPGKIGLLGGLVLLAAFAGYLTVLYWQEKNVGPRLSEPIERRGGMFVSWILLVAGLGLVILSSELVMDKALELVEMWNLRQSFVGAVIVACGTSLPELALTINAAVKNQPGLSLGNIIGSNVFDCLVPVGVAASIASVKFDPDLLRFDLPYLFMISGVVVYFLYRRVELHWRQGVLLCLLFAAYLVIKISME